LTRLGHGSDIKINSVDVLGTTPLTNPMGEFETASMPLDFDHRLKCLGSYEDVNDADRLGRDPAMRWIVGGGAVAKAIDDTIRRS